MKEEIQNLNNENPAPVEETNENPNEDTEEREKVKYRISITEKWKEIMHAIKAKTGIDGLYVIIFLLICVFLVYIGIFGTLITNLVGTLYPGFSTIKAMEKKINKKKWLTYWAVYGSFIIFDMFSNIIMKIIPLYFVLKIIFLIWMFIPGSNGCMLVYNFLIFKLFKSIESTVDFFFNESKDLTKQLFNKTKKQGVERVKKFAQGLKSFKGLGTGVSDDMAEAVKEARNLEIDRYAENPMYGKEFHSTLSIPSNQSIKKIEEKGSELNNIKEESKEISNCDKNENKEEKTNIANKDENALKEIEKKIEENKNKNQTEEEVIEFSDEVIEEKKN